MPDASPERLKARLRLQLRAERASGLRSLPVQFTPATELAAEIPARTIAPIPPRPPAPAAQVRPTAPAIPAAAAEALFVMPTESFTSPILSRSEKIAALSAMDENEVRICVKCRLCQTRTNTAFGEGDPDAKIMFIGEGPGENEDLQGRPFVGKAGQLLDKMIGGMGLRREDVYICNIVKCRPPNNREPAPDETATCTPYLLRQIEIVRPEVIITLGRPASQFILQTKKSMSALRGNWQSWRGIDVMPTYHPAYVLRQYTQQTRAAVWSDLKQVLTKLKMPAPGNS